MTVVHRLGSWGLMGLGAAHTLCTPLLFGAFSPGALWFAGSGLAFVFLGALNLSAAGDSGSVSRLCVAANCAGVLFGVATIMVVSEPQALVALAALVLVLVASVARRPDARVA